MYHCHVSKKEIARSVPKTANSKLKIIPDLFSNDGEGKVKVEIIDFK